MIQRTRYYASGAVLCFCFLVGLSPIGIIIPYAAVPLLGLGVLGVVLLAVAVHSHYRKRPYDLGWQPPVLLRNQVRLPVLLVVLAGVLVYGWITDDPMPGHRFGRFGNALLMAWLGIVGTLSYWAIFQVAFGLARFCRKLRSS